MYFFSANFRGVTGCAQEVPMATRVPRPAAPKPIAPALPPKPESPKQRAKPKIKSALRSASKKILKRVRMKPEGEIPRSLTSVEMLLYSKKIVLYLFCSKSKLL